MIEHDRQIVVEAASESKCSGEKAGQGGVVLAEQRIERSLAIAGCALCRSVIGAV